MKVLPPLFLLGCFLAGGQAPAQETEPQKPVAEVVVTATAAEKDPLDAPYAVDVKDRRQASSGSRTLPEALARTPSVMVQKTAYGQSSPFLRGFTGYRTLLLVDGIRLNHAAMRDGPNQYWSTVDGYTVERLEVVRGPSSVLYGSDAVGGTVNAVSRRPDRGEAGGGWQWGGAVYGRYASAEDSYIHRAEAQFQQSDQWAMLGGLTLKDFNDLEGGADVGRQIGTGYEERDGDFRLERYLANGMTLTFAAQTVRQIDVPRTHKTRQGLVWHGTNSGSERKREQDQVRDLVFARGEWQDAGGLFDAGSITLSWQRHAEERDRLRTGRRRDIQGFELHDLGLLARFQSEGFGRWSWGVEAHRETVDSFRDNYTAGTLTGSAVQGPVGDQATYTTLAAYVQNEQQWGDFSLLPGIRFTRISMEADRVANPNATGPAVVAMEDDWNALVGSLRGQYLLQQNQRLYAGLSQGFRAPSLTDTTAVDSTSVVERPSRGLEPEHFLQAELGYKARTESFDWQVAAWHTWVRDMIVRSPTGASIGGTPVVRKDNVGDGWLHGLEADLTWYWAPEWSTQVAAFYMDGEVDQLLLPAGRVVREPSSRLAPLQGWVVTRWQPLDRSYWVEGWAWAVDNQDNLSLRDATDTSRIPPGGSPGYTIFGLTLGWEVDKNKRFSLSLENLGDKDYRVHGSGLNGPGRSIIGTFEVHF
ncbi:MAG: TonB-dependent receptor [Planctomycetota bacterium]|nr:MAG: TonB-dependent receptor [Planctomycetota bacterium]